MMAAAGPLSAADCLGLAWMGLLEQQVVDDDVAHEVDKDKREADETRKSLEKVDNK